MLAASVPVCASPCSLTVAAHWISVPRPDFYLGFAVEVAARCHCLLREDSDIGCLLSWACLKRLNLFRPWLLTSVLIAQRTGQILG